MECYNENGFLEELLAQRSDSWETNIPAGVNDLNTNGWSFGGLEDYPYPTILSNTPSFEDQFTMPIDHQTLNCSPFSEFYEFSAPEMTDNSSNTTNKLDTPPFPAHQEDYSFPILEDKELGGLQNLEVLQTACKMEPIQTSHEVPAFNMGSLCQERKSSNSKVKKMDGQPSKNLMAERRRRKRLNDRLSMLRSVVPKISKMDRTSILGDTIDYMKELLERINNLQEEIEVGSKELNIMSIFKEVKPNEVVVRNSPKFDVERRNMDTRIEICCAGKQGLLLSTVSTLEALGLEIQQCVISCFNDFAFQASCSEEVEQRAVISSEDIKQALFRNAGYGGRCF
ncbi:transcription factor bHLH93-like [Cornus florida]|uniref:transcription factor bHLH93-like n=1 Tax=Cornus florida TaxID=4283 RepID=UPI0028965030|nr:transcription factor bHLH93-like [Cornus florida]